MALLTRTTASQTGKLQLTNNELALLRMRVIALENLMIALLAETSVRQRDQARAMAAYISPRAGFTQHPLTIHAAAQMLSIVERAGRFVCMCGGTADGVRNDPGR